MVIFSDESFLPYFQHLVEYTREDSPKETSYPVCLLPNVKHRGGSVMIQEAISGKSVGPMVSFQSRTKSQVYLKISSDEIHPMAAELFSEGNAIFQDDNAPIHTTKIVSEQHEEHSGEVEHLIWLPQPPDFNIIENLWCI